MQETGRGSAQAGEPQSSCSVPLTGVGRARLSQGSQENRGTPGYPIQRRETRAAQAVSSQLQSKATEQPFLLGEKEPIFARSRIDEYDLPHENQMVRCLSRKEMVTEPLGPRSSKANERALPAGLCETALHVLLPRPTEGSWGAGHTCQHPAGRSPAGEGVRHLATPITQCQCGWEIDEARPHPELCQRRETQMCPRGQARGPLAEEVFI